MYKQEIADNVRALDREKIKEYMQYRDSSQQDLFDTACEVRNKGKFGNNAELRSVIELSNICSQKCRYCSMGKNGSKPYILDKAEVTDRIKALLERGRRTFLLQSGELRRQDFIDMVSECTEETKKLCPDARIILCLGNLEERHYVQLKNAGADRYILKFETSDPEHHKYVRPSDSIENRLSHIRTLIKLGYGVGTGNIVGLPGQTADNLADDLVLIDSLDLAMVSATKFIPNEFSDFADMPAGDIDLTLNFISLLRILKPDCLIPSTSSLEARNKSGQLRGLLAGCNTVTIHDGTPEKFKKDYAIYSNNRFTPAEKHCTEIVKEASMAPQSYLI